MWGTGTRQGFAVNNDTFNERLFPLLITGDRPSARAVIAEAIGDGWTAEDVARDGFWPVLDSITTLFRQDQLTTLAHHYATRLLRSLVDQVQAGYQQGASRDRSVLLFCGPSEADDLAAQIVADLCEADGFTVRFGGGGVAADEILAEVQDRKPDVLMLFSSSAADAPHVRGIIDTISEIGAVPNLQVVVGGGIFNRVEGLAEEIGADLWGSTPSEIITRMVEEPERRASADQRTVGRNVRQSRAA